MGAKRTLIILIRNINLKFIGYLMKKKSLESLTHIGDIKSKRDRGKHKIRYITWRTAQGLKTIAKWENKIYKRQEVVESHACQNLEETQHIEEEEEFQKRKVQSRECKRNKTLPLENWRYIVFYSNFRCINLQERKNEKQVSSL